MSLQPLRSKLVTLITTTFATFYAWRVGASFAWLLFPPEGVHCVTAPVWALWGMALYFAPVGLVLMLLQLWLHHRIAQAGWRLMSAVNALLLAFTIVANLLALFPG